MRNSGESIIGMCMECLLKLPLPCSILYMVVLRCNALVAEIDVTRGTETGLASAIRLHVLQALKARLSSAD